MRQNQRSKLLSCGINSIDDLALSPEDQRVPGMDPEMFARLRDQARMQLATESRNNDRPA